MASSTHASHLATGGLLLLVLLLSVTTWLRPRQVSALRVTIPAGTVLPFAVWYGRGERQSPLAFVYTGFYSYSSGSLNYEGSNGLYWSRTAGSGSSAYDLYFNISSVDPQDRDNRGHGFALRCVGR